MTRLLLTLVCVWSCLLAGCATSNAVTSQVSSFGAWPQDRKPGKFVFERLPSQQANAAQQDRLEWAAKPSMVRAGFEWVQDEAQADVTVQVAAYQTTESRRSRYDPFWGPWGPGFGGWWGSGGRGGISLSMQLEPAWTQMQVDLLIRDRRTNQVLYETHARHERVGQPDERVLPLMFEAALKDFPLQAISPRAVTITPLTESR